MMRLKNILLEDTTQSTGTQWLDRVKDVITVYSKYGSTTNFIQTGKISQALLNDIEIAVQNTPSVTSIQIGSTLRTGKKSHRHGLGQAVDIPIINGKRIIDPDTAKKNGIYQAHQDLVATFVSMGYMLNRESGNDKAVLEFEFDRHKYDPKNPSTYNMWQHRHHIHVSNRTQKPSPLGSSSITTQAHKTNSKETTVPIVSNNYVGSNRNMDLNKVTFLRNGDSGKAVEQLHILLSELDYDLGPADELGEIKQKLYGVATTNAIRSFQIDFSLEVTGLANDKTLKKIRSLNKDEKSYAKSSNEKTAPTDDPETIDTPNIKSSYSENIISSDIIVSTAQGTKRTNTTLILFGGTPANKYGPEYMKNLVPEYIKNTKDIIYINGDDKQLSLNKAKRYKKSNSKIDSIIGFDKGAYRIFDHIENDQYKFIGLIDPAVPDNPRHINIILNDNVKMWANPSNWKGKYLKYSQRLETIIELNPDKQIIHSYGHFNEMFQNFMNTHKYHI